MSDSHVFIVVGSCHADAHNRDVSRILTFLTSFVNGNQFLNDGYHFVVRHEGFADENFAGRIDVPFFDRHFANAAIRCEFRCHKDSVTDLVGVMRGTIFGIEILRGLGRGGYRQESQGECETKEPHVSSVREGNITSELTRRRESKPPPPHQVNGEHAPAARVQWYDESTGFEVNA